MNKISLIIIEHLHLIHNKLYLDKDKVLTYMKDMFNFRVADPTQKENLGIIVQYKVKVKLCLGALGG